MRAIREINPAARLIQTDDLGKIYSTRRLQYQADFENERRWLGWDLTCGRVDRSHPMWRHLRWAGIDERELGWFLDNPCPPDIIGINHYLTSERYIDERLELYPPHCYGSNGRDQYADVEAVRVLARGPRGIHGVLQEAWDRYRRPLAITEVHLGCTREEQMRWLLEVWGAATSLCRSGIDIRAVTAWALLGSYDWNSLLTRFEGHYEPGAFDVRGGAPRPTALAYLLRQIASGEKPCHPVLSAAGWWRRPGRILFRAEQAESPKSAQLMAQNLCFHREPARPILIAGAGGTLGTALARICSHRNLANVALSRQEMDVCDPASVEAALRRYDPWAVVNAAGYTRVDDAERDRDRCMRENVAGPALLAALCARREIALLTFSSDLVFNGRQSVPYVESDDCSPANTYGRSKVRSERSVQEILPSALIVRPGALFGPWDSRNPLTQALHRLARGITVQALEDVTISPTYVPDLLHACLDLLTDGEKGIWHLANEGEATWAEFIRMAAERAGLDGTRVEGCTLRALKPPAARPRYSALGSVRGHLLQPLDAALECFLRDCGATWLEAAPAMEHEPRTGERREIDSCPPRSVERGVDRVRHPARRA
jgi:dTDP-4-dehydrorhamnose reductase